MSSGEEALRRLAASIGPPDEAAAEAAAAELDRKTKPRGSLARLEQLAVRLAAARGEAVPEPLRYVIWCAATRA